MEFIDVNLSYNKINIQLLANNTINYIKKRYIFKIKGKANKFSKFKAI